MSELPTISGKDAIKVFQKLGFGLVRTSASHFIMKKPEHRFLLSVPVHRNADLKSGTLRGLIRDSGYSIEEFTDAMNE